MQWSRFALGRSFLCGLAVIASSGALGQSPGPWRTLFDGTTTKGWRTYGEATLRPQWRIVDGALTLTEAGGGNITFGENVTGDFEFELEWRISPGGNSGILYFAEAGDEKKLPWETGLEMQILDNATHQDRFNPMTRTGAMYALYGPSSEVANPAGQWNRAKIRVEGANVEQWLNGVRVVATNIDSEDFKARVRASKFARYPNFAKHHSGLILLQDHMNYVQFRKIRIRTLNPEK